MTDMLQAVSYAPASSPPFQAVVTSTLDFEGTLARLKQGIEAADLWLIQEIDPQMLLQRGGYLIAPARQLLFFHPRYVVRLLAADPAAVVEVPLKLVVLQMPDGSVTVRHADVRAQLDRYPGMQVLAEELAAVSARLLASVAPSTAPA
ncbi:MAG TPA: DUF302 domain-containing protein [Rhodanobacter sp.]|jgi:uncharacterized protein (DUF302 family)|nr:DUF302 domain-containing protein [Rhodanobacter sp.]